MSRIAMTLLILIVLFLPARADSQIIRAEAEWMTAYEDLGNLVIWKVQCHYASNDSAVDGIDFGGEWIQLDVTFPKDGCYENRLRSAGLAGIWSTLRLTLLGQTSDVETLGSGIGWSPVYSVFAGSEPFVATAGNYSVKVELLAGRQTRLDYVEFQWTGPSSSEARTWGRIKTLFR